MKIKTGNLRRPKWSSEKGFIFAMSAAAVGLGNIWRFPYVAGENGGAAFILAYLVAVVVVGLPLMLMEVSAGRVEHGGVVKTFRALSDKAAGFGWLVVILTTVILSYYLVITGWTLGFAVESFSGQINSFSEFTSGTKPILYFFIALFITAVVAFRGLKLIEHTSRILMPLLLLTVAAMAAYSLTLDGRNEAVSFLFSPDFSALGSTKLWALAFGQAFYSLAIGQGYLMTYGSFLPKNINLPRAVSTVAIVETSVALLAGFMIFPIVFTFGLNPGEGTELAFETLPVAFGSFSVGPILAMVFFSLLFFAAISSCIASMEVIKTVLKEELNLDSGKAVLLAVIVLLPLGLLSAVSFTPFELEVFGRSGLEVLDMVTANQVVILSGLIGGAIISWKIHRREIVRLFSRKYRHFAWHTVIVTRFLWIFVVGVLALSLIG